MACGVGAVELHVNVDEVCVRGCMLVRVERVRVVSFRCSAAIEIGAVSVDGVKAFYTRTGVSGKDGNLNVFVPDGRRIGLWSPVPECARKPEQVSVVITWTIGKRSPSLVRFPGVVGVTIVPYGIGGWMPEPVKGVRFERLLIKTEEAGYVALGPSAAVPKGENAFEFELSGIGSAQYMGWIVGKLKENVVSGVRFLSVGQVDLSVFAFLDEVAPLLDQECGYPFVILPRHPTDVETTSGFAILSAELLIDYCDFPTLIPLPWHYQIAYAISYALAFRKFGRVYMSNCGINWLVNGLISYAARPYLIAAIGETAFDVFEWVMLRYSFSFTGDATLEGGDRELSPNMWRSKSALKMKALYVVQILVNLVPDQFRDPERFLSLWRHDTDRKACYKELHKYFQEPNSFIDVFLRGTSYVVLELSYDVSVSRELRSLATVTTNLTCLEKVTKSSRLKLPLTVRAFHETGSVAETVNITTSEDVISEFSLPRPRRRTQRSKRDPIPMDGLLFCVAESNPRMPIIVMSKGTPDCQHIPIINIIKSYSASPFAQHDALASLQKILLHKGDTGSGDILDFLDLLIKDDALFFSLRCHAIHILCEAMQQAIDSDVQEKSKTILVNFFFQNIIQEDTMVLKRMDNIPIEIVVAIFRAISSISQLTEKFSSFDCLRCALTQIASSDMGPAVMLCFLGVPLDNMKHVRQLQILTIEHVQAISGNVPLITAAVNVFNRVISSIDSEIVTEKVMLSMLDAFLDRKVPCGARSAVAKLLINNFPVATVMSMQNGLRSEMESDDPDYAFILRVVVAMHEFCKDGKEYLSSGRLEMHSVLHEIMRLATDTDEDLYKAVKSLFVTLFDEWPYKQTPDGLIRGRPLDFENRNVNIGMFSDD